MRLAAWSRYFFLVSVFAVTLDEILFSGERLFLHYSWLCALWNCIRLHLRIKIR